MLRGVVVPVFAVVLLNSLPARAATVPPPEVANAPSSQGFIGVVIEKVSGTPLSVREVMAKGPAQRAGLEVGDQIMAIEGTPTDDLDLAQAAERLRGEPGVTVHLDIIRGTATFEVEITRAPAQDIFGP